MGKCIHHPDHETGYICLKHNIYLCEDCLKCRDPDIYCKFRPSCPIYFISKKGFKEPVNSAQKELTVVFEPGHQSILVPEGANLLEAAQKSDIYINASCSGNGACGKCKLILQSGTVTSEETTLLTDNEKEKGYILACRSTIHENVTVKIPEETIEL
jgi:ferredoxin